MQAVRPRVDVCDARSEARAGSVWFWGDRQRR
jgi:hypothetical protein